MLDDELSFNDTQDVHFAVKYYTRCPIFWHDRRWGNATFFDNNINFTPLNLVEKMSGQSPQTADIFNLNITIEVDLLVKPGSF